jgi:hypothetical protein
MAMHIDSPALVSLTASNAELGWRRRRRWARPRLGGQGRQEGFGNACGRPTDTCGRGPTREIM